MKTIAFNGPRGTCTFQVTSVYERTAASDKRVIINRGGTRSSKPTQLPSYLSKNWSKEKIK
ncbi:MAG TPA: hypothetical protein VEC12_11570 [Bacteroidia bacterium]|nr:hypothetical protein [Bacteroidia bacterium]